MNITAFFGITIGVLSIVLGNVLEGGHFAALIQVTAFIIVFGGTIGATILSHSHEDLSLAVQWMKKVLFSNEKPDIQKISDQIIEASRIARKESVMAIEKRIPSYESHFMQSIFRLVVDGVESKNVEEIYLNRIELEEEKHTAAAKVWMDAGGFSPTIGIIGAVLGLIHVMGNLSDTDELGKGIAVAFVATIYGVASANLFFIPISNKTKSLLKQQRLVKEMIVEGAVGISNGHSSYYISVKMQSYLNLQKGIKNSA